LGAAPVLLIKLYVKQLTYTSLSSAKKSVIAPSPDPVNNVDTGYGLDEQVVGVRVPVGARIVISP
jgi:hypothetical protein